MDKVFVKKKVKRTRIDLDANAELVEVGFKVSSKDREKLREEAFRKKVSQGSIMRQALKDHFKDEIKRREELGVKLEAILDSCVGWLGGFEIDGDGGFVEVMYANGLKLEDLSDDQWKRVKQQILVGWEGYSDKPSPYIFVGKFLKLSPSEKQKAWLESRSDEVEEAFEGDIGEEVEVKEEDFEEEDLAGFKHIDEGEEEGEEGEEEEEKIHVELVDE